MSYNTLIDIEKHFDEAICQHQEKIAKLSRQRITLLSVYHRIQPINDYYEFQFNGSKSKPAFWFYYIDSCDWANPGIGVSGKGQLLYNDKIIPHVTAAEDPISYMQLKGFLDAFFLTHKTYKKRFKPTADYLDWPQKDPYKPLDFWSIRDKYAWLITEDTLSFKDLVISWWKDQYEYRVYLGEDKVVRTTDSTWLHYYLEGFMLYYGRDSISGL